MDIDYDEFRCTTWEERISIFSALSAEEKAQLVRSQISGWLQRHHDELSPAQVEILEEAIALAIPERYSRPKSDALVAQSREFAKRARAVLTPEQARDALTMQWGLTCRIRREEKT